MNYIKDFDTYIFESNNKELDNTRLFMSAMNKKGYTYADILKRLNDHNIYDFDEVITSSGFILPKDIKKLTSKEKYAAGGRDPREAKLACIVGNIQEALFTINNNDFKGNVDATNIHSKSDVTKEPDLIHKPTNTKVEFKVSYCYLNNDKGRYNHRDGGFKRCMKRGQIMIVYFIHLNKVAVIDKHCLDNGIVQIDKEHVWSDSIGKYIDIVYIDQKLFIDYDLLSDKKYSEISDRVSEMINERKERDKKMGELEFTGNPDVDPYLNDKVYSQDKKHFYVDLYKTVDNLNNIYKFNPYEEVQEEGSEYREIWLEIVEDIKEDETLGNKTVQEKDDILLKRFADKLGELENIVRADDPNLYLNKTDSQINWKAKTYNKCKDAWEEYTKMAWEKHPNKKNEFERSQFRRKKYEEFIRKEGIEKYAKSWIPEFSRIYEV